VIAHELKCIVRKRRYNFVLLKTTNVCLFSTFPNDKLVATLRIEEIFHNLRHVHRTDLYDPNIGYSPSSITMPMLTCFICWWWRTAQNLL